MDKSLISRADDERIESVMTFELEADQIPPPPASLRYSDKLRWAVCAMPSDHSQLTFVAGVFAYCLQNHGITQRQASAVDGILAKLADEYYCDE